MKEEIAQIQKMFVTLGSSLADLLGLSEGMGRMIGLFFSSPGPVSLKEITTRLELTKGTVSVYIRLFEDRKLISRVSVSGSGREKYFQLNPNLWNDLQENFSRNLKRRSELVEETIRLSQKVLEPFQGKVSPNQEIGILQKRLEEASFLNGQLHAFLENGLRMLKINSGPDFQKIRKIKISK